MYAKFENGELIYAPKILKLIDGYEIINPTNAQYLSAGFQQIVRTPQPEKEGYYYTSSIENINGVPTEVWTEHEIQSFEE